MKTTDKPQIQPQEQASTLIDRMQGEEGTIEEFTPQCNGCTHFNGTDSCPAFGTAIPMEIYLGEVSHTEPYDGDNGIQFEPIKIEQVTNKSGLLEAILFTPLN